MLESDSGGNPVNTGEWQWRTFSWCFSNSSKIVMSTCNHMLSKPTSSLRNEGDRNFASHKDPRFRFKLLILCYHSLHAIGFLIASPPNPICSKFSNLLLLRPAGSNLHLNVLTFSRCYQNFSNELAETYRTQCHLVKTVRVHTECH